MPSPRFDPPPVQLRRLLERARENGEDFDQGWYRAMHSRHSGAVKWSHDTAVGRL